MISPSVNNLNSAITVNNLAAQNPPTASPLLLPTSPNSTNFIANLNSLYLTPNVPCSFSLGTIRKRKVKFTVISFFIFFFKLNSWIIIILFTRDKAKRLILV